MLGLYGKDPWKGIFPIEFGKYLRKMKNLHYESLLSVCNMAILRPGVRVLGRREPRPNLIRTVCGPSQYFYTDAAKRQAARGLGEGKGG